MHFDDELRRAIESKSQIRINYENKGHRIVCPHVMYISSAGNKNLDAYQMSGYSETSSNIPGWREFCLAKITELTVLNDSFEAANKYNPDNRERYVTIIERI